MSRQTTAIVATVAAVGFATGLALWADDNPLGAMVVGLIAGTVIPNLVTLAKTEDTLRATQQVAGEVNGALDGRIKRLMTEAFGSREFGAAVDAVLDRRAEERRRAEEQAKGG